MATATLPKVKAKRFWTYDEMLAELPETNVPTELWDREIVTSPTPTSSHQTIVPKLARALDDFIQDKNAGTVFISPLDVVLSQHRVVQPDVFFVAKANSEIIQDRIRGVPDLVVEVISQTWKRDRVDKKALYEQFGVSEYWIVDPESRAIEVFALTRGVYQRHSKGTETTSAKSRLLAGFKISFHELRA
ncbi:MAG TPA: Uma2 family endonuclease [Candidatus Angelobacter sp.]|nr:Uma2 family endonuclease [Candidatus Angelobacter sp.]